MAGVRRRPARRTTARFGAAGWGGAEGTIRSDNPTPVTFGVGSPPNIVSRQCRFRVGCRSNVADGRRPNRTFREPAPVSVRSVASRRAPIA